MPSFSDVGAYLEDNALEQILSDVVADCVEEERPQPLAAIADRLYAQAAELAIDWDYAGLTEELRELIHCESCGPQLMQLAFADCATYSAAIGDGGPNAALRFADGGEGTWRAHVGFSAKAVQLLEPIKARYPRISRADLWVHAANTALEAMGGPVVHTRFGRRDAASSAEGAQTPDGRLVDDLSAHDVSPSVASMADELRAVFGAKGFGARFVRILRGRWSHPIALNGR